MTTEKLSVTVDAEVASRVKELAGHRGVSAFVDRALQHEVARADLRSLLDELEAEVGPADPAMVAEAEAMLARLEQRARAAKRRAVG